MKNTFTIILAALLFSSFATMEGRLKKEGEPNYKPGPEILQSYTGTYTSLEMETFYTLELRDSTLTVLFLNGELSRLDAVNPDLFKGDISILAEIKFIRNGEGKLTGFEVSNEYRQGVRFVKD